MNEGPFLSREELMSCLELGKALTSELDSEKLFTIILNKLSELIPAKNWSLLLLDHDTGELYFSICVGITIPHSGEIRLKAGEGVAGMVAASKETLIIEDVSKSDLFSSRIDDISGFKTESIIAVPLLFGGETVGVLEAINPEALDGRVSRLLKIIADYAAIAVENMKRYHLLETQSIQDNLTCLYNTRYLYANLTGLLSSIKDTTEDLSVIFMDLDNFKFVVDTYGHLNGSRAIQEVAETIMASLEKPEYGVSYAGDEFVVVLPGYNREKALKKAEYIRGRMNDTLYLKDEDINIEITASFGVSSYPGDGTTLQDLLHAADKAMFSVKGTGKNGVRMS
jgi:diguanylate cyclase (GGDEF)-like protein